MSRLQEGIIRQGADDTGQLISNHPTKSQRKTTSNPNKIPTKFQVLDISPSRPGYNEKPRRETQEQILRQKFWLQRSRGQTSRRWFVPCWFYSPKAQLVGGFNPSEKCLGILFPIHVKISNVLNHQPDNQEGPSKWSLYSSYSTWKNPLRKPVSTAQVFWEETMWARRPGTSQQLAGVIPVLRTTELAYGDCEHRSFNPLIGGVCNLIPTSKNMVVCKKGN